jgi:hypothetical protein
MVSRRNMCRLWRGRCPRAGGRSLRCRVSHGARVERDPGRGTPVELAHGGALWFGTVGISSSCRLCHRGLQLIQFRKITNDPLRSAC